MQRLVTQRLLLSTPTQIVRQQFQGSVHSTAINTTSRRHLTFQRIFDTMGSVFGKENVAEPAFDVLLSRTGTGVETAYDIRQYGKRFAIETEYNPNKDGNKAKNDNDEGTKSPFFALAGYIGVMGDAQNEGSTKMAMTAPVAMMDNDAKAPKGEKMAMTAPVAMMDNADNSGTKTMQFILPAEYDSMDKIPKPTNPNVHVKELEPSVGVVHRFSGTYNDKSNAEKAKSLAAQLKADGLESISEESAVEKFQFWGYNPPFTIPMFRRNEVWLELKDADAQELISKFGTPVAASGEEAAAAASGTEESK